MILDSIKGVSRGETPIVQILSAKIIKKSFLPNFFVSLHKISIKMANQTPYLDVQNLTKRFGAQVLFDKISFPSLKDRRWDLLHVMVRANLLLCLY